MGRAGNSYVSLWGVGSSNVFVSSSCHLLIHQSVMTRTEGPCKSSLLGFHRAVRPVVLLSLSMPVKNQSTMLNTNRALKNGSSRYPFHYLAQDIRIHTVCAHIGTSPEPWRRHIDSTLLAFSNSPLPESCLLSLYSMRLNTLVLVPRKSQP